MRLYVFMLVCVRACVFLADTLTEMDEAESVPQRTCVLLRQYPLTSARPAAADMLSHRALVNDQSLSHRWVSHRQEGTVCVGADG